MTKRGLTIAEVLIATAIVATGAAAFSRYMIASKRAVNSSTYNYVAVNLARYVIEWGASNNFLHPFKQLYYYPPATTRTIHIENADLDSIPDVNGINTSTGYALKEWSYFAIGNPNVFTALGDIKAKNLVPPEAPDSVIIGYDVTPDPKFDNAFRHNVTVSWKDTPDGPTHMRELTSIGLSQVNAELKLKVADFSWTEK